MAVVTSQAIQHHRIYEVSPTRKLVMGIVEILIAAIIFFVFAGVWQQRQMTKFVMTPGGIRHWKDGQLDCPNPKSP